MRGPEGSSGGGDSDSTGGRDSGVECDGGGVSKIGSGDEGMLPGSVS